MLRPVETFTAIQPRGNMVLMEDVQTAKETSGGLALPDSYTEGPARCRVLAVGPGNRTPQGDGFVGIGLKPGDIVGHSATSALTFNFQGRKLTLMNANSVVCVFDEAQIQNQIRVAK